MFKMSYWAAVPADDDKQRTFTAEACSNAVVWTPAAIQRLVTKKVNT